MPNTIAAAGHIVTDNEIIHATGPTADAAWANFQATMADIGTRLLTDDEARDEEEAGGWIRSSAFTVRPATAALIQAVDDLGGAIVWDNVAGIACTPEELENLD